MKYRIYFLQRVEVFSCEVEAMDVVDDDVRNATRDLTESETGIYDKMLNSEAVETGVKLF